MRRRGLPDRSVNGQGGRHVFIRIIHATPVTVWRPVNVQALGSAAANYLSYIMGKKKKYLESSSRPCSSR